MLVVTKRQGEKVIVNDVEVMVERVSQQGTTLRITPAQGRVILVRVSNDAPVDLDLIPLI